MNDRTCHCNDAYHWFLTTWGQENSYTPKCVFNIRLRIPDVLIISRLCSFVLGPHLCDLRPVVLSLWLRLPPAGCLGQRSDPSRGSLLTAGISAAYADCGPPPPPLHSASLFACCFFSILLNFHFGICWCEGSPAIPTIPYFSGAFPNPSVGRSTLSLLTSCDSVYGCLWPLAAPQTVFFVKPHLDLESLRGKRNKILCICLKNFY